MRTEEEIKAKIAENQKEMDGVLINLYSCDKTDEKYYLKHYRQRYAINEVLQWVLGKI